jgi:hypothetical protein
MDNIREELERAFALDDAVRAEFEQHERQRADRSQLQTRSGGSGLIFKTFTSPPMQQQQSAVMDAATQAAWNAWLTEYVARALEANNDAMVDATAEFVSEYVHKHLKNENTKLREEIGSLRADIEIVRSITKGTVTPI